MTLFPGSGVRVLPSYSASRLFLALICVLLLVAGLALPVPARAEPQQQNRGYIVRPGDSLSEIAQRVRASVEELMALNGINDADDIKIGQLLLVPSGYATSGKEPPSVEVDVRYAGDVAAEMHTVSAGESLSEIAERYGIAMADLLRLNGIVDADSVVEGQRLRLTHAVNTDAARVVDAVQEAELDMGQQSAARVIASLNRTYRVELGDDIAKIAIRFGVDEDALRAINGLTDAGPMDIEVGQELVLPATAQELQVERVAPAIDRVEHVVQAGESLGLVAEQHGLSIAELLEANYISDPDTVYVGQTLTIPGQQEPFEPEQSSADRIGRPRSGFYYYSVKPGDTLSELARDFDSTQLAIMEYNDLPDTETVYNGLPLRIPYGPPPLPGRSPPTPLSGTRFLVSLSRQQCWVLDGEQVLHQWTCSTGYGKWITRTGAFKVQTMQEMAESTVYELDMPYWLGIYDVGTYENGIHGLPISWETGQKIWDGLIGMPATFGCAMLDDDDAATLYNLAYLGMPVYIVP